MDTITARNITVQDLFDQLASQQARKIDVVLPATALTASAGQIQLNTGAEPVLSEYGITSVDGLYTPADTFVEHLAEKLGIPVQYLRKLAADRPDLFDANIDGWLQGGAWQAQVTRAHGVEPVADSLPEAKADGRRFLFRGFSGKDGEPNQARGLLSDKFKIMDNLDVITAVLQGFTEADAGDIVVSGSDLTDRHLFVRFLAPQVTIGARALIEHYRSPFAQGAVRVGEGGWSIDSARRAAAAERSGYKPGEEPVLWAGFEVKNSELGFGRFTLTPRAELAICGNGLKIAVDADAHTHLGSKLAEGRVDWAEDTRKTELELIRLRTRDTVKRYLDPGYWEVKVAEIAAKADKPVKDAEKTVTVVSKSLGFSDAQRKTILDHFIMGGQLNAGGVLNAITSAAQTEADAEAASEMESQALKALDLV